MTNKINLRITEWAVLIFLVSFVLNFILYNNNKKLTELLDKSNMQMESSKLVMQSLEINNILLGKKIEKYQDCCKLKK